MRKLFLLFILLIAIQYQMYAQSYKIQGEIKGLEDTELILGFYGGNKFGEIGGFSADTAYSKNGKFVFKGNKKLEGGMYFIVIPNKSPLELIVTEPFFSFTTNINDILTIKFYNSKENPPFYEYIRFMQSIKREATPITNSIQTSSEKEKKELEKKLKLITKKVDQHKQNFIKENPNIFFTKLIKIPNSINDMVIPKAPLDSTGKPDKFFTFRYYKKHFWDAVDFQDPRMLRTRIFHTKLNEFIEQLTVKNPDSIKKSVDVIIKHAKENPQIFKYIVHQITAKYEQPKIMGMQAIFIHMVENYYMQEMCDWVDQEQLQKMIARAEKWAPNMLGKKAPEFIDSRGIPFMKDIKGETLTLEGVKADYTLVLFYSPDCGHCKKKIPKIKAAYDSLTNQGINIKIFAVNNAFEEDEWKDFIIEQKIENWINVGDRPFKMQQHYLFQIKDKDGVSFVTKEKKDNFSTKKVDIKQSYLIENEKLNIQLFKQLNPKYKTAEFIFNEEGEYTCGIEETPRASSDWRDKYDIRTTPVIYMLNKTKHIIGREVHSSQISKIIEREEKKKLK